MPIVSIGGDAITAGLARSLARPGGNVTGVSVHAGSEIYGKRLQILKEADPSASKAGFLTMEGRFEGGEWQALQEASRRLQMAVVGVPLQESTPAEYRRAFAEIAQQRPDAIIVGSNSIHLPYRQLIVELVEKSRLPAIYAWRDYVEAGGLMAYPEPVETLAKTTLSGLYYNLSKWTPSSPRS